MSKDVRKDFVLASTANYLGLDPGDASLAKLHGSAEINNFLDDGGCSLLVAWCDGTKGSAQVHFNNKVEQSGEKSQKTLVFVKLKPDPITPDNLHSNVFVSSMLDSPVMALYHSLHKVYAPMLLKDEKWSRMFDPKLQKLLSELDSSLGSVVRAQDSSGGSKGDDSNMTGILTPSDEFRYWADTAVTGRKLEVKERAEHFQSLFQPVSANYGNLESLSLLESAELVEQTQEVLDDVWGQTEFPPYPEPRMAHLMGIIGGALARHIQLKLSGVDLWHGPYASVRESLRLSLSICERWISACDSLTSTWKQHSPLHPWQGDKFVPEALEQFKARLEEIQTLRTVNAQLLQLLTTDEQQQLKAQDAFSPFSSLNPLQYNPYTQPQWKAAVGQYEHAILPVEQRVASKLRSRLLELQAKPHQLLREFQRYRELVKRPSISQELVAEREMLLSQLQVYVKGMRDDFRDRSSGGGKRAPLKGKNHPELVNNIVWVRQLEAKVAETLNVAEALLGDLSGFRPYQRQAAEVQEEMQTYCREQFDGWAQDTQSALEDPHQPLSLQISGRLMELDHQDGKLHVMYSEKLVTLLREVRQLSVLGFAVPAKIQHAAATAQKFYKYGVILKQVAHFYNTIDQQMIPSQQAMLLDAALNFERIIKNPKSGSRDGGNGKVQVTWDNPEELEAYVQKLQAAAERIMTLNRQLRKHHTNITDKVVELMNTDLLRQQPKWKEGLMDIRHIMAGLVQQGFSAANMKSWKMHWDRQLYKALEHQYQMGLEALSENLSEIKVELVFRQQQLQFRPPLEEIRAKYYRELKKFICIPNHFKGVSEQLDPKNTVFPAIIERNSAGFTTIYRKAEELFQRLVAAKAEFQNWVVLGLVDLEKLVETHLHNVPDWERNFKALKARGRDAEKLPSSIKVDCIAVSTTPVKAIIDDHIQALFDALLGSLRHSIISHLNEIDTFLTDALESLSTRPQSVEEIGLANAKHAELAEKKPQIQPLFAKAEQKNKLLRSVSGGGVDQLGTLQARWDKFELMMESHQLMVKEQVEVMKSNVESQVSHFRQELAKFAARWHQLKPKDEILEDNDKDACNRAVQVIKEHHSEFGELEKRRERLVSDCVHFGLPEPQIPEADELREDLRVHESMWSLYEEFNNGMSDLAKEDWISFRSRSYMFEEFLGQWAEKLRSEEPTTITIKLTKDIDKYRAVLPLLKYVRGEVLSQDHWLEMFRLLGMPRGTTLEKLTFGHILASSNAIIKNADQLKELNARAQGEVSIREALRELEMWGAAAVFALTEYSDSGNRTLMIIKDWKDLVNQVGDNQCLLQSLKDSPYYRFFEDKASIWETRLADLDEYLHNLNQIQRKWVYLEPIFGRGALPREQARFKRVDDDFRAIMSDVARDNRVLSLVGQSGLRSTLVTLLDQLQRCQKSLNEFLEEKRSLFPRFYFIGDDDLLEILGQATNPAVIQSHLKKLFAGIHSVQFDEGHKHITAMKSLEGEVVPLKSSVQITTEVENWLSRLADEMKTTLQQLLLECLQAGRGNSQGGVDPNKFPSQILCLADQIQFTERCEEALRGRSLQEMKIELESQLEAYTSVNVHDGGTNDSDMHVLDLKLKALILDTVHNMDVVDQLIQTNTSSTADWMWQKQLKFYLNSKTKQAIMRMVDAEFDYTYEYQGNAAKLVHTPLTDKCYLTLTQGMHMGMGGNPYGPAGTGKTESVKALGGLFGRQVLVFNCDEGIDVKSMGRIFIGLVKCGAWGCFDEFNRLEEAVLSAVSMQIQDIQAALKSRTPTAELLGRQVDLDPNSGIFITLNPAGKGYGGRQKLPDNLKQLFRPVAMSRPDNDQIAEVILFSEGFKHAKVLGRKLVAIFNLSKELLTQQQHYDWGLRALKTVLRGCGNLLQDMRKRGEKIDVDAESKLVVQALRVNTLSKLTFADCRRFDFLVQDIFPGVELKSIEYEMLDKAFREACTEAHLEIMEAQVKKGLELYEQLRQRMGVVIVGPSGSGKSTLWRLLRSALSKMNKTVKQYTMNPKAMPRTQLLGYIDIDTREWSDGVLTSSARLVVKEPQDIQSWIVCDGDIDPEWIESLNSVLDDNRLLTMPSGERIQFGPNVNFVFESHDLSCASPATISRMGMIFLSDEDMDVKSLVASWLSKHGETEGSQLQGWVDDYFYRGLEWVMKQNEFVVETSLVGVVSNGLSHLHGVKSKAQFVVSLIRGLGSNLPLPVRQAFAKEMFVWAHEQPPDPRRPLDAQYDERTDRLCCYQMDMSETLTAESLLPNGSLPVVRTTDVQCDLDYIMPWLHPDNKQPFLLVGPEGCGKSMLLKHCFDQLRSASVAILHCSAQTSPAHVLQKLSQMCMVISTNTGRVYRPKDCERLILYLKDINLPKPDKWGTSQLIAFLQQMVTYQGFYDHNLEWVGLEGVQLVASMTAGNTLGRHQLTTRFTSVVRICSIGYADKDQLQAIYSAYLQPIFQKHLTAHPVWGSPARVTQLAASMVQLYEQVRSKFSVDDYSHYLFTPRDLTQWVLSLLRHDLAGGASATNADNVLQTWAFEACRLFRDKLVGQQARDRFDGMLSAVLRNDWSSDVMDKLQGGYYVTFGARAELATPPGAPIPPAGKQVGWLGTDDFRNVVSKGLVSYIREHRELDILVFQEVLDYMSRVDHALALPGGSLLMAGRSGVGRRTAASVVAHMHQCELFTPKISRGYGLKQFKNDLKTILQQAGVEGQQVVFLLEDQQLVHPQFLELVNSLLAAGDIPGLYTPEELDPLLAPLKEQASQENFRGSLYNYFAARIQMNLHVVLIMDCSNTNFTVMCESNPSLYKQCLVQWMEGWSKDSMLQVPKMLLSRHSEMGGSLLPPAAGQEPKKFAGGDELVKNFVNIHESRLAHGATPRRYMTFLHTYESVYNHKKEGVLQKQSHLQAGVAKLNEAKALVDKLKGSAAEQSALLAQKQEEADAALREITASMQNASEQKSEMEVLKQKTAEENSKLEKRKKAIDIELAEVEPLVQEAKQAVGNIKSDSLSEIRSLRAPPDIIRDILESVLRLMGIFDTSWVSMKSFLAKRGVKEEIMSFDARRITPEIRESVDELLHKNKASFDPKNAKRASTAAAPLASWVRANVEFSRVLEKIEPLETEQAGLKKNLQKAEHRMEKLQKALDAVDQKVAELRDKFEKRTTEAAKLKIDVDKANETIAAAENLVGKLDNEYKRWSAQVGELQSELDTLPKRAQLAAGFITYLASTSEDERRQTLGAWMDATNLTGFDVRRFLSSEREQLGWKGEGLPSDDLSMENALVILQLNNMKAGSHLRPFLVDPSSRAADWLKVHLKEARLEVVNQQDANFTTALELAVRFGKTLLIKEMDGVEPILYPLLRGDLTSQGPRFVVQIGDKVVDYHEDFRLFMATRNPNPEVPPDAASIITEVNFTTTRAGLRGQLLATTIQHEKPELEVRKTELLRQEEDLKVQLAQLEESLLQELANAQGNILENKDLLESLNKTKASSITITDSLNESIQLQDSLDKERSAYLPLAESGSTLFFVISDLSKLNNMYRFSLASFLRLFKRALETTQDPGSTDMRIKLLIKSLQNLVYEYVCRSLFKADRLMFAIHLVHGMYPELFQDQEWEMFLGLIISDTFRRQDSQKQLRDSLPSWIDQERATDVQQLKSNFPSLHQTLNLDDSDLWLNFSRSSQCEQEFPPPIANKISLFQQVLLVQTIRPDRLQSAMSLFAHKALNMKELSPKTLNLKRLYSTETTATEPILIIISPGADPSQELQELASATVGADRYHQVAMGQGQADIALQLLHECARNGEWMCLKNLHLVTAWLPVLEKELNSLQPHQDFRLWMTAEVHSQFPTILLQSSLKITFEAPPGIKKNLQRTYDAWPPEFIAKGGNVVRSQAFFALAWFHAVCQERRNYIPQGWTKFYEYSTADLRAAADIIDRLFTDQREVPWEFVHGLLENAIYGGRVDNNCDMSVLHSYLVQYFDKSMLAGGKGRGKRLAPGVTMPSSCHYGDFQDVIEALPEDDKPAYFGLPANIERSAQRIISGQVIGQLKVLMRSEAAAEKFDRETWSTELSPVLNLWKKLNQASQLLQQRIAAPSDQADKPIISFIQLERFSSVKLVQNVHQSLAALSRVIRGTSLLTSDVQTLAKSLLRQETPGGWQSLWEGPEDPMQYLRALVARAMAIQGWAERAEAGTLLRDVLDLSELFHPDTFLNALRQQTARDLRCPMDSLKFVSSWKGSISGAKLAVKIGGLMLEGCSFNGSRLSENQRDSPSVCIVPNFTVAWIDSKGADPYPEEEVIQLPLYFSADRDRVVNQVKVPCGGNQDQWVQCGAALFLKSQ
ncbi:cytoplasmic dynein 2 heavy chain 1-like isoform X1 [Branchiostoma lanceolatum]|uniref:cytoplasmic dynein 2 heavy chain 1-like isoform X1 n=1 Tax=Branchiostoma lanceolatum TaxID=7740 RepID=UPI00345157AB